MKHIYSSIDFGSDTIKIVVCELYNNKLHLLAASSVKSKGIKKGLITNVNDATISIKQAFNEVESMLGIKIKKVIAIVPSYFAEFTKISGETKIASEEGIVKSDDVVKLFQIAMAGKLKPHQEMVTIIPIDFKLDDTEGISIPVGLVGRNLKTRAILATVPRKNIYSVVSILDNVGVEVVDIMLGSIGDIYSFKTKEIDNKIGAVINIGAETTTVSLYNKGIIVKNSIIGLGGKSIDNDIAYMYKIEPKEAIKIKEKFALAHKKCASTSDFYEVTDAKGERIKISQYEVSEIVQSRIEEILELGRKEINILTNRDVEYIIITGGTSNMAHFEYVADEIFNKKATIGSIRLVGLRNNVYSSAFGNIIYFINKLKLKGKSYTMVSSSDMEDLSSIKKNTINTSNETMLERVFGYFFGE